MSERLERLLPGQADRVPVTTFHALGLPILGEHGVRLGLPASMRVASQSDRCELLQPTLSHSERAASQLLGRISGYKRQMPDGQRPEKAEAAGGRPKTAVSLGNSPHVNLTRPGEGGRESGHATRPGKSGRMDSGGLTGGLPP